MVDKRGWRCRRRRLALWPRPTAGLPQGSTHSGAKDQNTNRSKCANSEKKNNKHKNKMKKKNTSKTSDHSEKNNFHLRSEAGLNPKLKV